MNTKRPTMRRALVAFAVAAGATTIPAHPAFAAVNDSFWAYTTDRCGAIEFVDSGTYSNGTTNDDFFKVHDYCTDGHGVIAQADFIYLSGGSMDYTKYNGTGYNAPPVYWDPSNVKGGDEIFVTVCLVDGGSDTTWDKCGTHDHTSVDG